MVLKLCFKSFLHVIAVKEQCLNFSNAVSYQNPRFGKTRYGPTDQPTDGRTDRRTDRPSYRDAWTHLKIPDQGGTARLVYNNAGDNEILIDKPVHE